MNINSQKLQRFADEATSAAEKIAGNILAEVNEKKKNILAESERKINEESRTYVDEELKKLRRSNTREVSMKTMELRSEILKRREGILDGVMDDVVKKLREFAENEELYGDYLENMCVNVVSSISTSCTIYLSSEDIKKYRYRILKRLDEEIAERSPDDSYTEKSAPVFSMLPDETIQIGGAKFNSSEGGIFINETLDANLERQREQFTSMMISAMREVSRGGNQGAGR